MEEMKYEEMVRALFKRGSDIVRQLSEKDGSIWHAATGIAGEAGELLDAIKKKVAYQKPLDMENVIEELGDLEFYMEALRQELQITRQETLDANQSKLSKRYEKFIYSDKAAQERADKAV